MYVRKNVAMQLVKCAAFISGPSSEVVILPSEQLFMQVCTDNNIVPLIIPYNCIYALENPEVFADVPDYIPVDISN